MYRTWAWILGALRVLDELDVRREASQSHLATVHMGERASDVNDV